MSTKSRRGILAAGSWPRKSARRSARDAAPKAIREADRAEAEAGRSAWRARRAGAAVANHRPMPQRRPRLARGGATDARPGRACRSKPSAGRGTRRSGSWKPSLKCRSCRRAARAAGAHDQADRDAGDHAVQVGASGRGAVSGEASSVVPLTVSNANLINRERQPVRFAECQSMLMNLAARAAQDIQLLVFDCLTSADPLPPSLGMLPDPLKRSLHSRVQTGIQRCISCRLFELFGRDQ